MLKRLSELLRDSMAYGFGSVLEKLVGFLLIPVYTRHLLPGDYGVLAMLAILALLFEVLAFIGMKSSIFREFSLADEPAARAKIVSNGLFTIVITVTCLGLLSVWFARALSELLLGTPEHASLVRVSLLNCALATVTGVPLLILQAARRARLAALFSFSQLLVTVGITIVLVVVLKRGVWGVVVAQTITAGLFLFPQLWLMLREFRLRLDFPLLRRMLKYGLPFLPFRLQLVGVSAFAEYSVRSMLGLNDAGLYNVATRFAIPLGFVVQAINQAWWPYKFQVFKQEKNPGAVFRSIATYYFAAMNYLWVGVALWGPEVLKWMTPPHYHSAAVLVPILAFHRLLMGIYQIMSTGIELSESAREVGLIGLVGLIAGIASAYGLIPVLRAPGAAIAACLAFLVMTAAVYVLAQRRYRIEYDWASISGSTLLALLCVAAGYALMSAPIAIRIPANIAVSLAYPAIAFVLLVRSESERDRVRSGVSRIKARLRGRQPNS